MSDIYDDDGMPDEFVPDNDGGNFFSTGGSYGNEETKPVIDINEFQFGMEGMSSGNDGYKKEIEELPDMEIPSEGSMSGDAGYGSRSFSTSNDEYTAGDGAAEMDFSSGDSEGNEDGQSFSTDNNDDEGEDAGTSHEKMSFEAAEGGHKSKPRQLNKKFILAAVVTVFCLLMVVTFIMPAKSRKDRNAETREPDQRGLTDYSLYADNSSVEDEEYLRRYGNGRRGATGEGGYDDYDYEGSDSDTNVGKDNPKSIDEVEIPPMFDDDTDSKHQPYTQNATPAPNSVAPTGSGGSGGLQIPDTRNDRLQAKTISGIKGLSSTQQSYSTDYQQTIAKNTAAASATNNFSMPSKDEYISNMLNMYSQAYGNSTAGNNAYRTQNDQDGKNSFYNAGDRANAGNGQWLGLNTVWQGTIFEAVLLSAVNTDLPGEVVARVSKNIYSSQDGRFLLIPQNSLLFGTYNSSVSYAQKRVQVRWDYLIRPDGYRINLGGMNATDAQGASGLKGFVNDHLGGYLKAVLLMSVFSIANTELASQMNTQNNPYIQDIIGNSQTMVNELGDKLIDRAMNVQPTIKIKEGTKINIVVNQNLSLPPCPEIPVTERYVRE